MKMIKIWLVNLNKKRKSIIIITLIVFFAIFGYDFIATYNKTTMSLTLNYQGTDKGLNPDGTKFNIFEITSTNVLDKALSIGNLQGMTVDDLAGRIDIYAKGNNNKSSQKVKNAVIAGQDYTYIPNEYSISYSQKNKFSRNTTVDVLTSLSNAYKEYFVENYTEKNFVLESEFKSLIYLDDFKNYEYVEMADLYTDKIDSMIRLLQRHAEENGTFKSNATNQTFQNIISMLENLNVIQVGKFKAFVISSGLAKNKDEYVKKLTYNGQIMDGYYKKQKQQADFTQQAISKYDPKMTGVVLIPSLDSTNQFYMNRTKTGIDYLTQNSYSVGIKAEDIKKNIEINNQLISTFLNINNSPEETQRLTAAADEMIKAINVNLKNTAKLAYDTDDEYIKYKTKEYLRFDIPKKGIIGNIGLKQMVKQIMVAFSFAVLVVIGHDKLLKRRQKNEYKSN